MDNSKENMPASNFRERVQKIIENVNDYLLQLRLRVRNNHGIVLGNSTIDNRVIEGQRKPSTVLKD